MINKGAVDKLKKQIEEFEALRDILMKDHPGGRLGPIFKKLDELHDELLKELGYQS